MIKRNSCQEKFPDSCEASFITQKIDAVNEKEAKNRAIINFRKTARKQQIIEIPNVRQIICNGKVVLLLTTSTCRMCGRAHTGKEFAVTNIS